MDAIRVYKMIRKKELARYEVRPFIHAPHFFSFALSGHFTSKSSTGSSKAT